MSLAGLRGAAALLAAAVLVSACGIDPQAVRTGGTGSPKTAVAAGPITGLGSIVVNGVRFDETGAQVTIASVPDRPVSDLQLGMMVEVRGEMDLAARTGTAQTVVATPLLSGPVGAIDAARAEVTVLGQRVEVKPGTALQGASSVASLRAGDEVVVYGFWDYFANHVDATRLELRPAVASTPTTIIGRVGSVSGTRFTIGALAVETAGATFSDLPSGLAPGAYVQASGALDAGAILRATAVAGRSAFSPVEGALTEIEGYVTDFAGVASFRVLGLPVDGSSAQVTGLAASLGGGALVEVEGQVAQGVLVAARIDVRSDPGHAGTAAPTTIAGAISDFVSAASFRVRDQVVNAASAAFSGGTAANLANGRTVEVTGVIDGNVLVASAVAFPVPQTPENARLAVSGTIEAFQSAASFRVNGQPVAASSGTAFTGGTIADLADGRVVDVDGMLSGGVLLASAIVVHPVAPAAAVSFAGEITDFASAASFRVNGQPVATDGATAFEEGTAADLANGREVHVDGLLANGLVTATRVRFEDRDDGGEVAEAEVEGSITEFASVSRFKVEGQLVDATQATFSNGGPGDLANGLKVHVKGPVTQGILVARTVEIDR